MLSGMKTSRDDTFLTVLLLVVLGGLAFYFSGRIPTESAERWKSLAEGFFYLVSAVLLLYGVSQWRREFLGKRRLELAQDVISSIYELKDSIYDFRRTAHIGFPADGNQIQRTSHFDPAIELLFSKVDNLRRMTPKVLAVFNEPLDKDMQQLNELAHKLRVAARMWALGKEQDPRSPQLQSDYKIAVCQSRFADDFDKEVQGAVDTLTAKYLKNGNK